jgi:hypothetical protein
MKIYKLHRNSDFKNQPEGSSKLIINCNINYEFGSLTTEDGFDLVIEYPYGYLSGTTSSFNDKILIGHILLPDNSLCLISQIADYQDGQYAEVAILKNSTYRPILRAALNLSDKFPIEGAAKLNGKGETLIYFTDFNNPQRWLNLTNPQVAINSNLFVTGDLDELLYFPKYNNSQVDLIEVSLGGNLPCGAYIPVYKYTDEFYNETDVSYNSHVISLGNGTVLGNTEYDGGPGTSNSNKLITLNIANPDTKYTFVHLYLVYKASTTYVVYDCGYKNINNPITINSLTGLSTVPLETVTVKRANYTTAKTVTQLDSVLYWGNLKGREDFDFQPYVNNIVINPNATPKSLTVTNKVDFRNEITIYNERGFLHDEVYAFYASFFIEDEKGSYETKAYHIPGRQARTVIYDGTAVSPNITGGLAIVDSNGRVSNLDETESLNSAQVNYRLNEGTGFSSLNTTTGNQSGSFYLSGSDLYIDYVVPNPSTQVLFNYNVALLKQSGGSQSYYYVKILTTTSTPGVGTTFYSHKVSILKTSTNAPIPGTTITLSANGIFKVPSISNDYISNGAFNSGTGVMTISNTDPSPAGQMYTVNNGAKVFHAFATGNGTVNMGFWQNENETYANTNNWLIKNSAGVTQVNNFKGQKVRHHRFPHASKNTGYQLHVNSTGSEVSPAAMVSTDYEQVNILGIDLTSVTIPTELANKIKKVNIYYAKQSIADKLIVGQSIALHDNSLYRKTGSYTASQVNLTTNVISLVSNYAQNDDILIFTNIGTITGISLNTKYYVINVASNTFQISKTLGGSAIDLGGTTITLPIMQILRKFQYLPDTAIHSAGNLEMINQFSSSEGSFLTDRKYIRCSPFDNVATDTISNVTHINVLYKLNTSYNNVYCKSSTITGTTPAYPQSNFSSLSTNGSCEIDYQWRMDNKSTAETYCVQTSYDIFNRAVKKYNYIESVPGYPLPHEYFDDSDINNFIYGTDKSIFHHKSDKVVLSELYVDLNSTVNDNTKQTSAVYNQNNTSPELTKPDNFSEYEIQYTDIYLVNLCAFKEDLFQNFENKELAFAGSFNANVSYSGIFGGDTFSNYYGYRSTVDLAAIANTVLGSGNYISAYFMKFLHYFICQSISNINYRNNGTTDQDTYFPFTINNVSSFLRFPLIPNGQANYYTYNQAYNTVNDINQPQIGEMFKLNVNVDTFPTRIIRSAKDNVQSIYDNYRVVLANDYTDLPKDRGQIWALKGAFNKLNIFLENTFRETMGRERLLTQSAEAYIGAGDIFAVPPRELTSADGGYAGSMSQWAINVTPYGLFFVDVNRGRVFLKTEGLDEISLPDMFYFFQDQSKFGFRESLFSLIDSKYITWYAGASIGTNQIVKYNNSYYINLLIGANTTIPTNTANWSLLFNSEDIELLGMDSVYQGFRSAYDPQYKRIVLSKFDVLVNQNENFVGIYVPQYPLSNQDNNKIFFKDNQLQKYIYVSEETSYFVPVKFTDTDVFTINKWTIAYYPEYKGWGSFYTYYPDRIFSSNDSVYSANRLSSSNPYTKLYEHNKQTLPYFYLRTGPQTSTIDAIFNPAPEQVKEFKSIQFKTKANKYIGNKQSQEYLTTFDYYQAYDSYQLSKDIPLENTVSARNLEGYWSINNFRDWFNNGKNIFDDIKNWALNFNVADINNNKHWSNLKRFVDNWFAVRLKYTNVELSSNLLTSTPLYISQADVNEQIKLFVKITPPIGSTLVVGDLLRFSWSGITAVGRIYDIPNSATKTPTNVDYVGEFFTLNNNGLANGDVIIFSNLGSITGISLNTRYYIIAVSTNTFKISETPGGNAVNLGGPVSPTMPTFNVLGPLYIELFDYNNLGSSTYQLTSLYKITEVKLSLLDTVATYIKNPR